MAKKAPKPRRKATKVVTTRFKKTAPKKAEPLKKPRPERKPRGKTYVVKNPKVTLSAKGREKLKAAGIDPKNAVMTDVGPAKVNRHTELQAMLTPGATLKSVQERFGWLPHSARSAISTLGKKLNLQIGKEKNADGEFVYKLPAAKQQAAE